MSKLKRKEYEELLEPMQRELAMMARWAAHTGQRILVLIEGRDTAGKGGVIEAISAHINPRQCRTVALPKPSDRERGQWYFQRYVPHLPAAGELVLFDRSWYNRAGVELVMGFCTKEQHEQFLEVCPQIEKFLVDGGVTLIKLWLEVSDEEQKKRFQARIDDPRRQWKLSPMDLPSRSKWYQYSRARDMMLKKTDTKFAPWVIVRSDDKKTARLNTIAHILSRIPYKKLPRERITLPPRAKKGAYNDMKSIAKRRFVKERYR